MQNFWIQIRIGSLPILNTIFYFQSINHFKHTFIFLGCINLVERKISSALMQLQHTLFMHRWRVWMLLQIIHAVLMKGWTEPAIIALSIFFLSINDLTQALIYPSLSLTRSNGSATYSSICIINDVLLQNYSFRGRLSVFLIG